MTNRARATLAIAALAHFLHDGFADIVYVFLPFWAAELGLSLVQVGIIRTAYTGAIGLVAAVVIAFALRGVPESAADRAEREAAAGASGWGIRDARGFQALAAIGMIDNATRTGLLTFLPFALIAKGVSPAMAGGALALVFAGGAVGKFVCGFIAERLGVIRTVVLTEAATTVGILAVVVAPETVVLAILFPLGIALNGTSSVLYATVAELVSPDRRSRAYGLYYTLTIGASAAAPTIYGLVGDAVGIPATITLVGLVGLVTIPLCLVLRVTVDTPAPASVA